MTDIIWIDQHPRPVHNNFNRYRYISGMQLTLGEAVDTFSRVLGREIEYAFITEDAALANRAKLGTPD